MYEIGDLVVYGNTGICRVTDIDMRDPRNIGEAQEYYKLETLYSSCSIYLPVAQEQAITRRALSKDEANAVIDMIPSMPVVAYKGSDQKKLEEYYRSSLDSHECESLIELILSIYSKQRRALEGKGKSGAIDRKFKLLAEDRLFGELAAALDIDRGDVVGYIHDRIDCKTRVAMRGR
jgi:CarD family transcriptional regulator